jgi:hypothetical protein
MRITEEGQIVLAGVPVDTTTAGLTGDYVSLKNYNQCTILFLSAIGTAGQDWNLSLDQAKTVAGGSVKALNIDEVFHKVGATAISAVSLFTRVTQTAADGYDTVAIDGAENEAIFAIEVNRNDLDTDNDFDCLRALIADDVGAAQLGAILYILTEPRYDRSDAISD